jgi:hypothetical protein
MDVTMEGSKKINEFSIRWGKQFTFLSLRTYDTKLIVHDGLLTIETDRYYLGLFKGKKTTLNIPLNSLVNAETKVTLSFSDLVIAGIYVFAGFFNYLFFLLVPLSVLACFNTGIIITTNTDKVITIPSYNKKDAKNFINFINDLYIEK